LEDTSLFDLIQDRGAVANGIGARKLFEGCRVKGFELRIIRGEAVKLKLDIAGEFAPAIYPYTDTFKREHGERFSGDCAAYRINGKEYKNIYGVTLASVKEGGTKTELWVRRVLENGLDIPDIIEDFTITTRLLRDTYEARHYGTFTITLKRLVMVSDETDVDCSGAVIGPVRFHVSGTVTTEIFTSGETRL
jgi:hypothetical protein